MFDPREAEKDYLYHKVITLSICVFFSAARHGTTMAD